ncbi:hypothetical protein M0R45_029304 [Rubus argutus]|uniref:Lipin middle domain-containing protein n=1 Tax=Rubus argutus TaxID=59490 RepID=A0AAW1WAC9_RUBAR
MHSDSEDASAKQAEVFGSCLELTELPKRAGKNDIEDDGFVIGAQNSAEKSYQTLDTSVVELKMNDELSASCGSCFYLTTICLQIYKLEMNQNLQLMLVLDSISVHSASNDLLERKDEQMVIDSSSVHSVSIHFKRKDEQWVLTASVDETESSQERPASEDECSKSDPIEPGPASPGDITQVYSSIRFEISLCGNELRVGMGATSAAEAFDARRVSAEDFKISATSILKNENLIIRFRDRYFTWEKAAPVVLGMAAFGLDLPLESKDAIPVEQMTQKTVNSFWTISKSQRRPKCDNFQFLYQSFRNTTG